MNNPLLFTDPSGYMPQWVQDEYDHYYRNGGGSRTSYNYFGWISKWGHSSGASHGWSYNTHRASNWSYNYGSGYYENKFTGERKLANNESTKSVLNDAGFEVNDNIEEGATASVYLFLGMGRYQDNKTALRQDILGNYEVWLPLFTATYGGYFTQMIATNGGGGWTTTIGQINNGVGGLGTGMAHLDGSYRLTNGTANGSRLSPKYYNSNWTGGSRARITTYNAAKVGGRIVKGSALVTVGVGAYNIRQGYIQDGGTIGYNTYVASAETAGGAIGVWVGAEAGAAVGAAIGVWFGGVGAVPGTIIGGVVGGILGGWGGSELGGGAVGIFY